MSSRLSEASQYRRVVLQIERLRSSYIWIPISFINKESTNYVDPSSVMATSGEICKLSRIQQLRKKSWFIFLSVWTTAWRMFGTRLGGARFRASYVLIVSRKLTIPHIPGCHVSHHRPRLNGWSPKNGTQTRLDAFWAKCASGNGTAIRYNYTAWWAYGDTHCPTE